MEWYTHLQWSHCWFHHVNLEAAVTEINAVHHNNNSHKNICSRKWQSSHRNMCTAVTTRPITQKLQKCILFYNNCSDKKQTCFTYRITRHTVTQKYMLFYSNTAATEILLLCYNNTAVMGIRVMLLKLQWNKCTSVLLQSLHSDGHNDLLYSGTSAKKPALILWSISLQTFM